ncbi:MAG: hypothetical protein KBD06_01490 [Candidatus Pacebacteria bacterium]|nr:hypothetical protein [Candidatus Paceibacterota bacterium]
MKTALGSKILLIISLLAVVILIVSMFVETALAVEYSSVRVNVAVSGGSANASDFKLHLVKSGTRDTGSPAGSGNTVIFGSLTPGTYTVVQNAPSGYGATWGGACNAQGQFTVSEGSNVECSLANTYGTSGSGESGPSVRTPRTPRAR